MHKLILALGLLLLAACAAPKPPAGPAIAFRAAGAPMWSNAQLDVARLPGRWRQSASFVAQGGTCTPGGAEIGGMPSALTLVARLCLAGREVKLSGPMQAVGPGRFRVAGQEWWVIWVDTDYRTLAIGTPSGAFGFILNRGGALPSDRLNAAREIFDFNGYSTARLTAF